MTNFMGNNTNKQEILIIIQKELEETEKVKKEFGYQLKRYTNVKEYLADLHGYEEGLNFAMKLLEEKGER